MPPQMSGPITASVKSRHLHASWLTRAGHGRHLDEKSELGTLLIRLDNDRAMAACEDHISRFSVMDRD